MVRLDGFRKIDDRKEKNDPNNPNEEQRREQSNKDRGRQGFLLNDLQFESLAGGLDLSESSRCTQLRVDLDAIREIVLQGFLQDAERPTWPEIHKALAATARRLRVFLDQISDLGSLPDWSLADSAAIERPSLFHVFITLPWRLRSCAERARSEVSLNSDYAALLIAVAHAADSLADILIALDFASKDDVLEHLPRTYDYHLDRSDEVVLILRRLEVAVDEALAAGKKRGGPRPQKDLKQATVWLGNLFESYGGRFTHNPYEKTKYHGRPHSAAGRFVLAFLRTCDSTITEQAVSQYMAEAIAFRNGPLTAKKGTREMSS
jgi:hypothetical protein